MNKGHTIRFRCLVVDRDPTAHHALYQHIRTVPWLDFCGSCHTAQEALEVIPHLLPEIVFADVEMPELTAFQMLDQLPEYAVHFILTTHNPEHAMQAFYYQVSGFLLHPITHDRFLQSVLRVRQLLDDKRPAQRSALSLAKPKTVRSIWIKSGNKMHCIKYKHLYYIEGCKDYVKVYHRDGMLIAYGNIASILMKLPADQFIRVHRSYIVNSRAIISIEGNRAKMTNQTEVPIAAHRGREEIFGKLTGSTGKS